MSRISVAFLQTPGQSSLPQSFRPFKSRSAIYRDGDCPSPISNSATSGNQTYHTLLDWPPEAEEFFTTNFHSESERFLFHVGFTDFAGNSTTGPDALVKTLTLQNDIYQSDHETIQRVSGILDMLNTTGVLAEHKHRAQHKHNDACPTASDSLSEQIVVAKSVEGIIRRFYLRFQRGAVIHSEILEELESLLGKSIDLGITPTQTTLETLWRMQHEFFERRRHSRDDYVNIEKLSRKHVGRSVKLLNHWSLIANKDHSTIQPPPPKYFQEIFCLARHIPMAMTYSLWSLYDNYVVPRREAFSREVFTAVLGILAVSPPHSWKVRETSVLQLLDMMGKSAIVDDHETFSPSVEELESALETAAATGSSQQATWLLQSLQDRTSDVLSRHLDLWFHAVCNDTSEGSEHYLEHLLFPKSIPNSSLTITALSKRLQHREYYNLFIKKLANCGAPDAGMRAESAYLSMEKLYRETRNNNLRPNHDTLHAVVMAHMKSKTPSDVQLAEAQRFLQSRVGFNEDLQL